MFEKYKKFAENNSNKSIFIPRDQGEIEGKGLPIRGILKEIRDYLPYQVIDGKAYKTRAEAEARLTRAPRAEPKPEPKPAPKPEPPEQNDQKRSKALKAIVTFEKANRDHKQFLKDFKKGETPSGVKIKPEDYKTERDKLEKIIRDYRNLGQIINKRAYARENIELVKNFVSEYNKIVRLSNKMKRS